MPETKYVDYIMKGHDIYWDMLANMRGNLNHKGDICWLSGDIDFTYSLVLNGSDFDVQIDKLITHIKNKEIPNNLMISPLSAPSSIHLLDRFMKTGLFKMGFTSLGMLRKLSAETFLPVCEKCLNIYRVNDLLHLKECGAILNTSFEYDIFSYEHYLDAYNTHNVSFYLAEYNGLPVGACMSILSDDFVDIAWVGTLVGYRKKGIGGYLVNAAEKDAFKQGRSIAVLTAFERAINAYKRIGYNGYCSIHNIFYDDNQQQD